MNAILVTSDSEVQDHGSIQLIEGFLPTGESQWIAVDTRLAIDIIMDSNVLGEVVAEVEDYQFWGAPFRRAAV